MENIGQELKTKRTSLGLSIQKVADKTKVRAHIISDLEENYIARLEQPYISAFISTLQNFYKTAENDSNYLQKLKNEPIAPKKIKKNINNEYADAFPQNKNHSNINKTKKHKNNSYVTIEHPIAPPEDEANKQQKENTSSEAIYIHEPESNKQQTSWQPQKIKRHKSLAAPKVYFANTLNITVKEIITYISLALFLFLVVFFVFIYDEHTFDFLDSPKIAVPTQNSADELGDNMPNITNDENSLFTYIEESDSIVLRAVCHDTAWVKLELDDKKTEELLMLPSTDNSWSAWEKITLATSDVGNISFYKNDTLLPKLGSHGTMVKNIIITRNGISNVTPLSVGSNPVPANELPANIKTVNTTTNNAGQSNIRKTNTARRKKQDTKPITIIDFSKPNINKSPLLEQQEQEQD